MTGDFDALIQLSEATVNRLLATAHQNAFVDADHPSFPHRVVLDVSVGPVVGRVWAQIGTPRVGLIDRATNHFRLAVEIRARFEPAPGSAPLPRHIAGTVDAVYRLEPVDAKCPGWSTAAADHVWLRVDPDTVEFTGTETSDAGDLSTAMDPQGAHARVVDVVRRLLEHQFAATPHRVAKGFHPDSMIMVRPTAAESAVVLPVDLKGGRPVGELKSIHDYLLKGTHGRHYDVALAIDSERLTRRVRTAVDALAATELEPISVDRPGVTVFNLFDFHATWHPRITVADVIWRGAPTFPADPSVGVIQVSFTVDVPAHSVTTQKPGPLSSYGFNIVVTEWLRARFDATTQSIRLERWFGPDVQYFGPFAEQAEYFGSDAVNARVDELLADLSLPSIGLASVAGRLADQLRTLDPQAEVRLLRAEFRQDGVVVRGSVAVTPRQPPVVGFARRDDLTGFDAFDAWIPGGRIDRFRWSWHWFDPTRAGGDETVATRFDLHRPFDGSTSGFGIGTHLSKPLPGLDGSGTVCLDVEGVATDAVTGLLTPVSVHLCRRWVHGIPWHADRVLVTIPRIPRPDRAATEPDRPHRFVVEVDRPDGLRAVNSLVVRLGASGWSGTVAETLRTGLGGCTRVDAGLAVVVLLDPDTESDPATVADVHRALADLPAPLLVTEDVDGRWSRAAGIAESESQRWWLVTPTGGVSWIAEGSVDGEALATVLDGHLFPAPPLQPAPFEAEPPVLLSVSPWILAPERSLADLVAHCPPPPVGRGNPARVLFVRPSGHESSITCFADGLPTGDGAEGIGIVVVHGADAAAAEAIVSVPATAGRIVVIGDESGAVCRRFGVRAWPTLVEVGADGRISSVESSVTAPPHDPTANRSELA